MEHDAATSARQQSLKLAIDLGPVLIFFAVYMTAGIYWATGVLMVATLASLVASRILLGHVSTTLIITTVLVVGFGALTLFFNDPRFIQIKPTIVNLLFAVFLFGGLLLRRPVLQMVLGEAMRLTDEGWRKLTVRWAFFFLAMAVLNEIVWRNFSEATWASFKLFVIPITLVFAVMQLGLMRRYEPAPAQDADTTQTTP